MAITLTGIAQNNIIQEFPWNPDSDNDDFIGVGDLTGFLSVFGQQFGSSPAPCVYDGTDIEDWFVGIMQDSIVLDSVYFEILVEDYGSIYYPGCPDPIQDTIQVYNYGMLRRPSAAANPGVTVGDDAWGTAVSTNFFFQEASGMYMFKLYFPYLQNAVNTPGGMFFTTLSPWRLEWWSGLPFPSELESGGASFTSEGHLQFDWDSGASGQFDTYLLEYQIIPFWHEAE